VLGVHERPGQQRDAAQAVDLARHRRRDVLAVVDQRIARKQAGGVGVRPHAEVDDVEVRHFAGLQSEKLADVLDVAFGRCLRQQLAVNPVHLPHRNARRVDQVIAGQFEIAGRVGGRDDALVHPEQVDAAPLDTTTFSDSVEFNRERCYVVRAVRGTPPNLSEGDASVPNCFTPVDLFPPAAPARLVAVADEGGISLIWEPNAEPDVAGYLILRGEPTDATLQPLTPTPVAEARFRDTHVSAGKKYVYAVVAVDSRLPFGNISVESNRVEETAR